jgi:transposase
MGVVIERMHGIRFSQTQVWRILGSLGLSPQKPAMFYAIACAAGKVQHQYAIFA